MNKVIPYLIIHVYKPDQVTLKEVMSGIEEEAVLYQVVYSDVDKDSVTLAYEGSKQSSLGVGIGLTGKSIRLAVQQQLAPTLVELGETPRDVGHNGARLVKKKPLR